MSKIAGEINAEMTEWEIREMQHPIHESRRELFAEIVRKTGSRQSVIDRLMQEIESLREQNEQLAKERDIKEHCIVQLEAEDLRISDDKDRKDAARYRFLRKDWFREDDAYSWLMSSECAFLKSPDELDAEIDKAMWENKE